MKKWIMMLSMIMVLAIAGSVFALGDIEIDNHPTVTGGSVSGNTFTTGSQQMNNNKLSTGDVNVGNGFGNFSPSASADHSGNSFNINDQDMNNRQVIAPEQKVIFKSPTQLMAAPSQSVPELNFGSGSLKDVTAGIPNFAIYGIAKYKGEPIRKIISTNANVKFKNYFQAILDDAADIAGKEGFKSSEVRLIVACAEAQKTWTSGGNLGGAGSYLPSPIVGASGAASIVPQWGGTKADPLYTIFFVLVNDGTPSKVVLYEKKPEGKKVPASTPKSESKGWFKF